MGEPRAITYKEVERATGDGVADAWRRIGEITGAGIVGINPFGDASIDITGLSDAKRAQIDKLLEPEPAAADKTKGKEK